MGPSSCADCASAVLQDSPGTALLFQSHTSCIQETIRMLKYPQTLPLCRKKSYEIFTFRYCSSLSQLLVGKVLYCYSTQSFINQHSISQQFSELIRTTTTKKKKAGEAFPISFHPQSISELFTGSSFAQRLSGPRFPHYMYSLPDDTLHVK